MRYVWGSQVFTYECEQQLIGDVGCFTHGGRVSCDHFYSLEPPSPPPPVTNTLHTHVHVMRTYYAATRTVRQRDSCARDADIYSILSTFTKLNSRAGDECMIRGLCAVINSTRENSYCTPCVRAYSHLGLMMRSPSIEQTRSLGALPT